MSAYLEIKLDSPYSLIISEASSFSLQRIAKQVDDLSVFFEFNDLKKPATGEEKAAWKTALDTAYGEISVELQNGNESELLPLLSKVLTYNAHRLYGGDMDLTRLFFLTSLSLQLKTDGHDFWCALDHVKAENTLDDLANRLNNYSLHFDNLQEALQRAQHFSEAVIQSSAAPQNKFDIAANLDWLGRCCQNLSLHNKNQSLFKQLYGSARAIHQHIADTQPDPLRKDANWQIADNLYNTARFLHSLENPNDLLGKLNTLNLLKPYLEAEEGSLRAVVKAAQIENIMATELSNFLPLFPVDMQPTLQKQIYRHAFQALKIAQQKEHEGFDPFLLSMFYNNVACLGFDAGVLTNEEAAGFSEEAIDKATKQGLDHFYFASYFKVGAKIARALGNEDKALKYEDMADMINKKFDRA